MKNPPLWRIVRGSHSHISIPVLFARDAGRLRAAYIRDIMNAFALERRIKRLPQWDFSFQFF